jgi:hypothetical protein
VRGVSQAERSGGAIERREYRTEDRRDQKKEQGGRLKFNPKPKHL